ncbi:MAG: phage Gp37/Gp68 family protein [Thermodesulfovibrionales bacterium]|nr:phage Gp37/Gp68 family protein [Thermodesulfovibrionales bacterium]
MNRTKIEYLDYTTNPTVGCSGLGCAVAKECWAAKQAKRQKHKCAICYSFVPHVHWERFDDFLSVKKPSRIGVSFMGEFFDKEISNWVRKDYYLHMMKAPQHMFIIFTKQPQNIDDEELPPNLSIGVSVNRKKDLWRIDVLRQVKCQYRIVSFEPLYEDLSDVNLEGIDWVIIGGQTRPKLLPSYPWVLGLIQRAKALNLPVFIKNNLKEVMARWPPLREYPHQEMEKVRA